MINTTINKIVKIYLVLTIILTICGRIMPVKMLIGDSLESVSYIILAGMGAILLLLDLFTTRIWYKGKYVFILYTFIGVMGISSILNFQYGFVDNAKTIVWTGIQFGLIYTVYLRYAKEEMFKFLDKIWIGVSIAWLLPVCYSIWQFISLQGYRIQVSETSEVRQGFIENRLFGIFNDPNYAAVMSLGVILACIYLSRKFQNRFFKTFLFFNIVVQAIYISLSGSRTALLVFIVIATIFLWLKLFQRREQCRKYIKIVFAILIPVAVISVSFVLNSAIQKVAIILPQTYSNLSLNDDNNEDGQDLIITDTILDRTDTEEISNNREEIWISYLENMEGDWLFGGSPRNFLTKWIEKDPGGYLSKTSYETHNSYLLLLVGTGVVGFAVMLSFAILYIRRLLKYIIAEKKYEDEFIFSLMFIILILCYMFFFTELFFIHNYTSVLFWLHCGVLQYWIADDSRMDRNKV